MTGEVEILLRVNAEDLRKGFDQAVRVSKTSLADIRQTSQREADRARTAWNPREILGVRDFQAESRKIEAAYKSLARSGKFSQEQLAKARQGALRALREEGTAADRLTRKILQLGGAYVSLRAIYSSIQQILGTGGQFEQLQIQLNGLTGSAEAGEKAFAWIDDFVKNTPFGLDQVAQGFVKLKAFGLDPIDGTYQAIADQAARLGGSQETLNGIILAVGQAWAKQKLQGEEILQLVERGVPVWDLLAQVTGKTAQELQDMSEAGELGRDVIRKLIDAMGRTAQGAALDQVRTWNGLVSNARIEWQKFLDLIADSGVLAYFRGELEQLLSEVERMAETGELQQFARNLAEGIVSLVDTLKGFAEVVVDLREELGLLAGLLVVNRVLKFASGIKLLGDVSTFSAGAIVGVEKGIKLLLAGLRASGYLIILQQLAELYALYRKNLDIEAEARRYVQSQEKIIDATAAHRSETVLAVDALETMTAAELASYRKRLDAAKRYYQAKADLQSRTDVERDGITAPVSSEALALAREARIRREALAELETVLQRRQQQEAGFAQRLAEVKAQETKAIKDALADQLEALEDANKDLAKAQQRREDIAKKFKELLEEINAGPKKPDEQLTVLDPIGSIASARDLLQGGDVDASLKASERAREQIQALAEQGSVTKQFLTSLAQQAAQVADQAAAAAVANQEQQILTVRAQLEDLVSRADFLQRIEIGFDDQSAVASAEELRNRIQKLLAQNPIIMPVQLAQGKFDKGADKLLDGLPKRAGGGPLYGPGSETSDSILLWGSRGEWVIRAAAARYYGDAFMRALNNMQLPKYAQGGPILPALPSVPAPMGGGGLSGTPVNLHIGGSVFQTVAPAGTVPALRQAIARQSLKSGGRRD